MTTAGTPKVLQLLLSRGIPRPLSLLTSGSCAVISDTHTIAVHDSSDSPEWTLTAQARWPEEFQFSSHPWAAIAPAGSGGVVLLNMAVCDIGALPTDVRMSLLMQQQRYSPDPLPVSDLSPRYRVTLDSMQLFVAAATGAKRVIPVGAAFTVSDEAYRRHEQMTFSYLSPSLRIVARAISQFGPLSTNDLLHRVYPAPTANNKSALHVQLSRLRKDPRITLSRDADGRLMISHATAISDAS